MNKIGQLIILLHLITLETNAQILTSEVKVEQTNNVTLINGELGIKTNNPSATLHVERGTANGGTAEFRGTQRYTHFNHSTDEHTYIRGGKSNSNVLINDTGGYVGIGTNNPLRLLHVKGSFLLDEGSVDFKGTHRDTHFNYSTDEHTYIRGGKSNSNVLINDTGGNVGIRTNDPSATLHVERGTANGGTAEFRGTQRNTHFNYSTDEHTYIRGGKNNSNVLINDTGGNVGIGTNDPLRLLHVKGSFLLDEGSVDFKGTHRDTHFNHSTDEHTYIRGGKSNSNVLINDTGGNVGIGTNNPLRLLHVKGSFLLDEGSVDFKGTQRDTHFNHSTDEHTYIRGGKNDSNVLINDIGGGNVGVGTSTPNHKLEVNGSIKGATLHTSTQSWSDFVFRDNYNLRTLEELEEYIIENKHLPEIPSETEVTENGINLGEMDAKLLQKIEELTLYMIDMNKKVNQLEGENSKLKEDNLKFQKEVLDLKNK